MNGRFTSNSYGISASDHAAIEVNDSTFLENEIGIRVENQGRFEGKIEGSGNDFVRNGRNSSGAGKSIEEKLID
jgi:hypothetical protein